jgi:hypothetical protein
LTEKIKYLIEHPENAELMGKNAREKFNTHFTLNIFEERMKAVFHEV